MFQLKTLPVRKYLEMLTSHKIPTLSQHGMPYTFHYATHISVLWWWHGLGTYTHETLCYNVFLTAWQCVYHWTDLSTVLWRRSLTLASLYVHTKMTQICFVRHVWLCSSCVYISYGKKWTQMHMRPLLECFPESMAIEMVLFGEVLKMTLL